MNKRIRNTSLLVMIFDCDLKILTSSGLQLSFVLLYMRAKALSPVQEFAFTGCVGIFE